MKRIIFALLFLLSAMGVDAQNYNYTIRGDGDGMDGNYRVYVVVNSKTKSFNKTDAVLYAAVHGVMFQSVIDPKGRNSYSALIKDPDIQRTKADWFKAFFGNGQHHNFATVVNTTLSVMRNRNTKTYETSATVLVNKEALLRYLEQNGIVKGFSNLW